MTRKDRPGEVRRERPNRRDDKDAANREAQPELRISEETLQAPAGPVLVREAREDDLPRLIQYEIEIARISFPREPVDDPVVHEKKLRKALDRSEPGMLVLDRDGRAVGWLWVTVNTNFMTDERYATFRSMAAAATEPDAPALADLLFQYGIAYARRLGLKEITGKVHVDNVRMRLLYRQTGFESEHLTMKLYLDA